MRIALIAVVVAGIAAAAVWLTRHTPAEPTAAAPTAALAQADTVLGVDELMRNVDRHKGRVRVHGVVNAVAPQSQSLALIDIREAKECGVGGGCAKLVLPVRWAGPMPQVGQSVQLNGSVQETDGKLVFAAMALGPATTRPGEPQ